MGRFIPDEKLDEIRSRADIVDLIQSYIPLKKSGARFKALCPFHSEKTPSFMVNPDRQVYHCFGCSRGGDVFRFVMDKENMGFNEAALFLAEKYNVKIEPQAGRPQGPDGGGGGISKERLFKLNEKAMNWFQNCLHRDPSSAVATYLRARGLSDETVRDFRLGAAPDSWDETLKFCKASGFGEEELVASGLVVKNEEKGSIYDRFRNRLVFPVMDEQGRVAGFSARTVSADAKEAKYVNTPETPVFKKSRLLYGLYFARDAMRDGRYAVLCEGQMDVIALHRAGYKMSVAPLGTAFTEEQARLLQRYAESVILALDSDEAGVKAVLRNLEILLPMNFRISVASFPPDDDPDSLLRREGGGAVEDVMGGAADFFDYLVGHFMGKYNPAIPYEQDRLVGSVLSYVAKIESSISRAAYATRLSQRLKLNEAAVFTELNKLKRGSGQSQQPAQVQAPDQPKAEADSGQKVPEGRAPQAPKAEEELLALALGHGTVGRRLAEELPSEMISRSGVGTALETVINLTLNGEWEHAASRIAAQLAESPDPSLSRILMDSAAGATLDDARLEKAVVDCIICIKEGFLKSAIGEILEKMKTAAGPDKDRLRDEYLAKSTELKKVISQKTKSRSY